MAGSVNRQTLGPRFRLFALVHVVAGAVGGALALVVLRSLVATIVGTEPTNSITYVAVALACIGVLVDIDLVNLPVPSTGVQVPRDWRSATSPLFWVPAFGLLLGFTLLTRISTATVLIGLAILSARVHSVGTLIAIGAAYGLTRTIPILLGLREETLLAAPTRLVKAILVGLAGAAVLSF